MNMTIGLNGYSLYMYTCEWFYELFCDLVGMSIQKNGLKKYDKQENI